MPVFSFTSPNLEASGATLTVTLYPPIPIIRQLQNQKQVVPSKRLLGLIDTGASCTGFDAPIAEEMSFIVRDQQKVLTPSGGSEQYLYDVAVQLNTSAIVIPIQAFGFTLKEQPYDIIIGRDILRACSLVYDGWDNSYALHLHQEKVIY